MSLENANWTKCDGPIIWQTTFTLPNIGLCQVPICGTFEIILHLPT